MEQLAASETAARVHAIALVVLIVVPSCRVARAPKLSVLVEAHRFHADIGKGHRQQCHRGSLTAADEHVKLALGRIGAHAMREDQKIIRGVPHSRYHHNDALVFS